MRTGRLYVMGTLNADQGITFPDGSKQLTNAQHVHTQTNPSNQWTIVHNLYKIRPHVHIVDEADNTIELEPTILASESTFIVLGFTTPISGVAYLD
jgi:hypothetical protein